MNQYPLWKYLLIVAVVLVGIVYALPNLYGEDPALQISPLRGAQITESTKERVASILKDAGLPFRSMERVKQRLTVRFPDTEVQLKARDRLSEELGDDYVVALTLLPATPDWLTSLGAVPMYLGLDLRGGVHFLMEVDMATAIRQAEERYVSDIRSVLRKEKIRYVAIGRMQGGGIEIKFRKAAERDKANDLIAREYRGLVRRDVDREGAY